MRMADGNAAGDAHTMHGEAHRAQPNMVKLNANPISSVTLRWFPHSFLAVICILSASLVRHRLVLPKNWHWISRMAWSSSLVFTKLIINQRNQSFHSRFFVRTVGYYSNLATFAGSQHHHTHDAFGVNASTVALDPNFTVKLTGSLSELGRSAGVQAELVGD